MGFRGLGGLGGWGLGAAPKNSGVSGFWVGKVCFGLRGLAIWGFVRGLDRVRGSGVRGLGFRVRV